MKEKIKIYKCIKVNHHNKIEGTIEHAQKILGWKLHTYQAVCDYPMTTNHYLLFVREIEEELK